MRRSKVTIRLPSGNVPMTFLIVDNPFVYRAALSQVPTGCRHSETSRQTVCLQERFHHLVLVRGSLSKFKFTRAVVQASTELLESPVDSEFFEVSINTVGQGRSSSLRYTRPGGDVASTFKCARPHFSDPPQLCYSAWFNLSIAL